MDLEPVQGQNSDPMQGWPERIKRARDDARLSQDELGNRIGKSQSAIAGWETARREPSLDDFAQLGTALGVSPCWLIFGFEGTGENGRVPSEESDALDRRLTQKIIAVVERRLGREFIRLTPEAKARAIIALHDIVTTFGDESKIEEELDRYVEMAKRR